MPSNPSLPDTLPLQREESPATPSGGAPPAGSLGSPSLPTGSSLDEPDAELHRRAFRIPSERGPEASPLSNYRLDPYVPATIREREV